MSQATKAKFLESGPFHQDLKARVEEYLGASGCSPRDLPGMYAKTAVILGGFAASYTWLLFGATNALGVVVGCVSLGLAVASIGFSVQHDANHGSYSSRRGVNRLLGWTLDCIGGSSYVWNWKHNIYHHSHPNVPLYLHPVGPVALAYALTAFVLGLTLATVFQLAHCVEEATFTEVPAHSHTLPHDWATHQLQSTVDFARGNPLVTWYLGGLNFQVVHHLFPRVCHLHYPALSFIVEGTCREHGVNYRVNESVGAALKSHVRWLKRMGQPVIEGAV